MLIFLDKKIIHDKLLLIFNSDNEALEYHYKQEDFIKEKSYIINLQKYEKTYISALLKNQYKTIIEDNVEAIFQFMYDNRDNLRNDIFKKFVFDFIQIMKMNEEYELLLKDNIQKVSIFAFKNEKCINWNNDFLSSPSDFSTFLVNDYLQKIKKFYNCINDIKIKEELLEQLYITLSNLIYNYDFKYGENTLSSIMTDLFANIKILQINDDYIFSDAHLYKSLQKYNCNFNKNDFQKFIVEYNYYNIKNQLINFNFTCD